MFPAYFIQVIEMEAQEKASERNQHKERGTMERRGFLKRALFLTTAVAMPLPLFAEEVFARGREVLSLNRGWRFSPEKHDGAHLPGFDDAEFETVVLPHSNVRLPWHNFDDVRYEFVSTYLRRFKTPPDATGKRVFVDFEGSMTATAVWINGVALGEYRGGFTPFSFELTQHLKPSGENVLVAQVDSTERADIPPFGNQVDYMTFGGIYREVSLRIVPYVYLDNIFAYASEVMSGRPTLDVDCFLAGTPQIAGQLRLEVSLLEGETIIASAGQDIRLVPEADPNHAADPETTGAAHATTETVADPAKHTVSLRQIKGVKRWDLSSPHLYEVRVRLLSNGTVIDEDNRRIGFREAVFTDHGFSLNGRIVKLRGLDRHQTFPFVGQAMPARVQRRDAMILKHELHCNIVRTSHYPQSRHFLDCCDEIGLLVLEEIPGWQHIGPEPWKQISIDNVGRMVRRDWNHPSIVLWGTRINESPDDHDFYARTNALCHLLDPSRQNGGVRNRENSELLEDVFTINDFGFPLRKPNHPRYLNTEFVGHTFPTRLTDNDDRQREHTLRHARIHNQLASDPQYAGGIGWCAFDYNTHADFGSGDRICYHGVMDIFRTPKAAAGFYRSQCDPEEEVVLEPAFHWADGDANIEFNMALVCSNCEQLKFYTRDASLASNPWKLIATLGPDREAFPYLKYGPFDLDLKKAAGEDRLWGDLRIDGYIAGKLAISKTLSGRGINSRFELLADDSALMAHGADATRVVLRVTDEFGAPRPLSSESVVLSLTGPAELIGENPFSLVAGTGAVWVKAKLAPGEAVLTATHPQLGTKTVSFHLLEAVPEAV